MTTAIANRSEQELADRRRWRARILIFLAGCNLASVLAVLPWHHYAVSVRGVASFAVDRTAIQSPDASLGIAALVLSVLLVLHAAAGQAGRGHWADRVRRLDPVLPPIASLAVVALLGIKALTDSRFLGTGAWIAFVLAAVLTYGTLLLRRRPGPHGPDVGAVGPPPKKTTKPPL